MCIRDSHLAANQLSWIRGAFDAWRRCWHRGIPDQGRCRMSLIASLVTSTDNPIADFSDTPWWLSLVKALFIFVFLMINTLLVIWFERRVIGRMQQRPGPNRTGPFGLLQTLADGMKLALKEDLIPKNADKVVFLLAPVIAGAMAFVSFSIIPMGSMVSMFGHRTPLQLTDTPVAVLLVLAVAGVGVYGIVLAGWSSGSTYPLLGGLRSTAQVISYEIAMGLSLVAIFLYSGSMSTSQIVASQKSLWFIVPAFFSFLVYVVTMVGETNRLPFDLAEGEGELTGGFHTEYSSLKFAMFFLGEYVNMFTVSALATTMFLGGWQAPPGIAAINDGMFNQGWWGLLWFVIKLWMFMFFFVWLRGSEPRSQTKKNMNIHSLMTNHNSPHQPWLNMPSLISAMPGGACQPPRNVVVASAETVNMLTYSPRKNIANFSELYSVWNPPVSSPSPSARSKGCLLYTSD